MTLTILDILVVIALIVVFTLVKDSAEWFADKLAEHGKKRRAALADAEARGDHTARHPNCKSTIEPILDEYAPRQHERKDPGPLDTEQLSETIRGARPVKLIFDEATETLFDAMKQRTIDATGERLATLGRVGAASWSNVVRAQAEADEQLSRSLATAESARQAINEASRIRYPAAGRTPVTTPEKENDMNNANPTTVSAADYVGQTGETASERPHLRVFEYPIDSSVLLADVDRLVVEGADDFEAYVDDLTLRQQRATLSALATAAGIHDERASQIRAAIQAATTQIHNTGNHLEGPTPVRAAR